MENKKKLVIDALMLTKIKEAAMATYKDAAIISRIPADLHPAYAWINAMLSYIDPNNNLLDVEDKIRYTDVSK